MSRGAAIAFLPAIRLPRSLELSIESTSRDLLQPAVGDYVDFSRPPGEAGLVPHDSISWRIFKNPIALLVGGIAAVILELAEPAVRSGVWQHSSFRQDPMGRLRRTGLAAMVTVYGARSIALPMIANIVRMHSRVAGETPAGERFAANDPRLLTWVHTTAGVGFSGAYGRYVAPLDVAQRNAFYRDGAPAAALYGALDVPASEAAVEQLFLTMHPRLEASPIVFEFLDIMRTTPGFPAPLRRLQPMLVRAAVDLVPDAIRATLGLDARYGLRAVERLLMRAAGAIADKIVLPDSPPSQACQRLGLPKAYLYG